MSDATESLVDAFLLNIQAILGKFPPTTEPREGLDKLVRDDHRSLCEMTRLLKLSEIRELLNTIVGQIAQCPHTEARTRVSRILPFLDRYNELIMQHLRRQSQWTMALFKLEYVACCVMKRIAVEGFCQPPEAEESGSGDEGAKQLDGTGLGEGTGTENVSKDIEDESQVEGLQGEGTDGDEKVDRAEEDNAIEMSEDFGGGLQDVSAGESGDEDGEEEAEEHEERMGDLDHSDPSQIDEKLWNGEKDAHDQEKDESTAEQSHSEPKGASEMTAKDEKKSSTEQKAEQQKDKDEVQQDILEQLEHEVDEGEGQQEGLPMDEHVDNAEILDLPEDLNIGEDRDADKADEDVIIEDMEDSMSGIEEDPGDSIVDELNGTEEKQEDQPNADATFETDQLEPAEPPMDSSKDPAVAKPDVQAGESSGADNNTVSGTGSRKDTDANVSKDQPEEESNDTTADAADIASSQKASEESVSNMR